MSLTYIPRIQYFSTRFRPVDDCWIWTASKNPKGYAVILVKENGVWRKRKAYRWFYEYLNGPISREKEIDHLCEKRLCVNPSHLEVVKHKENIRRHFERDCKRKTCSIGHRFLPTNIIGKCITCNMSEYLKRRK